jgi:hypothetical protein
MLYKVLSRILQIFWLWQLCHVSFNNLDAPQILQWILQPDAVDIQVSQLVWRCNFVCRNSVVLSNLAIRNGLIWNKLVLRNHFPWTICHSLHKDKELLALRNNFRWPKSSLLSSSTVSAKETTSANLFNNQ